MSTAGRYELCTMHGGGEGREVLKCTKRKKHNPCGLRLQGSKLTSSSRDAEEVKEILQKLDLSEYCPAFEKEKIDGEALVSSSVVLLSSCFFVLLSSPPHLGASSQY